MNIKQTTTWQILNTESEPKINQTHIQTVIDLKKTDFETGK